MTRVRVGLGVLIGGVALGLVAWPVYAHCGKCALSGSDMVKMMAANKVTLASAIASAETRSKGKAVAAFTQIEGSKISFDVYCMVDGKIMQVGVDMMGKAKDMDEVNRLPIPTESPMDDDHDEDGDE